MKTIKISEDTHRKLKKLKEDSSAESFDKLLQELSEEKLNTPESMFGALKGKKR